MRLYHFTAAHLLPAVRKEGLTLGSIPVFKDERPVNLIPGFQWLTTNPSFEQEWQSGGRLPYRRNAYRITVKIPRAHDGSLVPWLAMCPHIPGGDILNALGDPENWMIFGGRIPPGWFREIVGRS